MGHSLRQPVYDGAVPISAQSRIIEVAVHARGAVVTRAVELPPLPAGEVDLVITLGGITPLSDAIRAEVRGSREVIALQASLHVPSETARPGASVEKLAALERTKERLSAEMKQLEDRRAHLLEQAPAPPRWRAEPERFTESLQAAALLEELAAHLDVRRAGLERELLELQHRIDAAALEDSQRSAAERMGSGHPTRQIRLRLGDGGPVDSLQLSYQVPAARWWPVYTLRLTDGGKRAAWWLEALVAQRSGEDWGGVKLSLATADLIHDARLPELPSLRLGRKQPPAKKAYRPAPEGLEQMFRGYDRAFAPGETRTRTGAIAKESTMLVGAADMLPAAPAAAPMFELEPPRLAKSRSLVGALMPRFGGGAAKAEEQAAAPPEPEPAPIEPPDAWLDFDRLVMTGLGDPRRGRLRYTAEPAADDGVAVGALEHLAPEKARDPRETRGLFDHRYDAAGAGDVPSDGLPQRITVGVAEAPCQLAFRTIPREAAEVYKEARLQNPFASPLLAGPVDVYVEGSLLLTSEIDRIDVGGEMTVGLGVEDRIRVARNARVDESSAGLLGGSSVVDNEITIDLTSSLGREARVEVADRLPATDDDDLAITLVSSKPAHAEYDQKERGSPIRHGLRWVVPLDPSGKSQIVFRYKLSFPSKSEIAGGNRRE
jgi:hypothetical protein